jgi:hypothetical protein
MTVRTLVVLAVLFTGLCAVGQDSASNASALATSTPAVVPHLVQFGGIARDVNGKPLIGTVGITFLLYSEEQGGAPLWMETQNVQADVKGHYSVELGATKPDGLPTDEFTSGEARWLGVQIAGQEEQPRVLLLAVPYALKAADASTIGGLPPSAFVRVNPGGGTAPSGNDSLTTGNASSGTSAFDSSSKNGASSLANKTVVTPGGKTDFLPLWTSSNVLGNSALFQSSSGQIGLNTTTPGAALDVSAPNQIGLFVAGPFSGVGAGLQLHTTGTGGKGWEILATGKTSAQGPSKLNIRDLSTAADVFTIAPGGQVGIGITTPGTVLQVTDHNVTGTIVGTVIAADAFKVGTAVFADVTGTSGLSEGVFGQILSPVTGSAAVIGEANGTSGQTSGVSGFNESGGRFAAGVVAAEEASSGFTLGVSAVSDSPNGTGVLGLGQGMSNTGNALVGCCAFGVWGDTRSNVFGDAALIGTADDARAIYLQNNSTIVPTAFMFQGAANQLALQAGGNGGFCTIDSNGHENCPNGFSETAAVASGARRVALYAMESPQHWFEDFGGGRLANGSASVTIETTFAETVNANSDYHVFLTPEGDCRGLYVSHKTASGFEVHELSGGQSNVDFSYRIVALRRGLENVRMPDVTEQWKKVNAPLPKSAPGPRLRLPARPPAPNVSIKSDGAPATLRAQK